MIPYEDLRGVNERFFNELRVQFDKVLESGWYILGNEVKHFEKSFSIWQNAKFCIGVANGLEAMVLALKALNFDKDDEVIVPSNTYIATILAVLQAGLKPVLVEPSLSTYTIDPDKIEEAISARTKAILVVHLYGKCCEMDKIESIKQRYNLVLIEDCAQSHGAKFKNKLSGTFGEYGCFSFYPTKNLGALGDAGAVICNEESLANPIYRLRNYGSDVKYYNEILGHNSRLDELQAAFLSVKLPYLHEITRHKRNLAGLYCKNLKQDFILPQVHTDYFDVYHIFNIRHPQRDRIKEYLLKNGIGTEIHYPIPPHHQNALIGVLSNQSFPISEMIHSSTLSLPCSYCHTEEQIYKVIELLNKF